MAVYPEAALPCLALHRCKDGRTSPLTLASARGAGYRCGRAWLLLGQPLVQRLLHLRGEHMLPRAGLFVGGAGIQVQHVMQEAVSNLVPTDHVGCDELPTPGQVQHLVLVQDEIALICEAGDGLTDRWCADLEPLYQPGSSWWHTCLVQLEHRPQVHLQRLGMLSRTTTSSVDDAIANGGSEVGGVERRRAGNVHPASLHPARP